MTRNKQRLAIYNPYLDTKGGGEKVTLAMAEALSENYEVTLISRRKTDLNELGSYFDLNLEECRHEVLPPTRNIIPRIARKVHMPARFTNLLYEYQDYRRIKDHHYDVFVNNCYKSTMPNPSKSGIYMCMFPQEYLTHKKMHFIKRIYHNLVDIIELSLFSKSGIGIIRTYDVITVNSQYTANWTKKLWSVNSTDINILYPICDNMSAKTHVEKEKIILNVGRFFADSGENHYKCQDKLLNTFSEMNDLHAEGWQLHFVGSVANDKASMKYLLNLIEASKNLPVFFHMNAPFDELRQLFQRSSIYWHATGWGSNAMEHPEKQEHFGISTVEAMSAGVVPIVIDSAGQIETVAHIENGYRWSSKEELRDYTYAVAKDKKLRESLAKKASITAKNFDKQHFRKRITDILSKIS